MAEIVKENMIRTHVDVGDWKEAARLSGGLLVKHGYAEERYIDKMIETVEEYGMYILVAPGVAFFHARPEHGAKKTGLSLITSEEGVEFGVKDKDPVKVMFALSAADKNSHVDILASLSQVLKDSETVGQLAEAQTPKNAKKILATKEKE